MEIERLNIFKLFTLALCLMLTVPMTPNYSTAQTSTTCLPPPPGLVSWWGGDGNANDLIGPNHGVIIGNTAFVPGYVSQAFDFDGISGYVEIGDRFDEFVTTTTAQFTIDAWVYPRDLTNNPIIIGKADLDVDKRGWNLQVLSDGTLVMAVNEDGVFSTFRKDTVAGLVPLNTWTHVATVVDIGADTIDLYVNGSLVPQFVFTPDHRTSIVDIFNNDVPVTIGRVLRNSFAVRDNAWNGLIDEVQIFNRALAASEIQAIFNAGQAGKCKVQTVAIDIKPGSFPNAIKLGENGSIPVAIFSSPTFDATTIDVPTLTLEGATVRLVRVKGFMASFEDVNQDGLPDLLVHFDRGELQLTAGDTTATLTGATVNGTKIEGKDSVKIIE